MITRLLLSTIGSILLSIAAHAQFKTDPKFNNADQNPKNKFYEILTSNSELNISNLATLSTKDSKLALKGNLRLSPGVLLNMNLNGSVNEGVTSLLSGLKVRPSLGSELGLHIYLCDNDYYSKFTEQYSFRAKQDSLIRERELKGLRFVDTTGQVLDYDKTKPTDVLNDSNKIVLPYFMYLEFLNQKGEKIKEEESIKKLKAEIKTDEQAIADSKIKIENQEVLLSNEDKVRLRQKIASSREKIIISEHKINQIDSTLSEYLSKEHIVTAYEAKENEYVSSMKKSFAIKTPAQYRISWVSVTGKLKNNSIKLFDTTVDFADQISKSSFNTVGITCSYNIYNLTINDPWTYFLRFELSHDIKDNLADLTSFEVEQTDSISASSGNSSRITRTKTAVYKKEEYKKTINSTSLAVDCYWFFSRKNIAALHLKPEFVYEDEDLEFNMGTGLFLSFKTKDKENPIVNVELFVDLADALRDKTEDERLFDRSTTNLSLNFPINFKTNTQ